MQSIRIAPVVFLVACSLDMNGTGAAVSAVEERDTDSASPEEDPSVPPADTPTCVPSEGTSGCVEVDRVNQVDPYAPNIPIVPLDEQNPNPPVPDPCDVLESDPDQDGTPDCQDGCPSDPNKIAPLTCGCGMPDVDTDLDGVTDCIDPCIGFHDDSTQLGCTCDPSRETCSSNTPPTVTLEVLPSVGGAKANELTIRAYAADEDSPIKGVSLFVDDVFVREEQNAPYEWGPNQHDFDSLGVGAHMIRVIAEDDGGASATEEVTVRIVKK